MSPIYLYLHLFTISFPLIRSFEPKVQYVKKWKSLFPAIIITATFFLVWDVMFTSRGVWGFNENYLIGLTIFGLPIEEWLFFITVPFASVFIYECIKVFLPNMHFGKITTPATWLLGVFLISLAIINNNRLYTFWNFLFAGIMILFAAYKNPTWLSQFWLAYLLHLIPFFLVNGILTGSFLESPIVWYNDIHNLSIRLFTIPIEDTVYALLLLLMNIFIFETIRQTGSNKKAKQKFNPA